jgi:hypothetical protein
MVVRDQRYMFGSLCLSSVVVSVLGIPTISTKGSKFFTSDGNQFYIKGMLSVHSCSSLTPLQVSCTGTSGTTNSPYLATVRSAKEMHKP